MHSGSDEVAQFVRAREVAWRWWENPSIARPMVSVVPIRPADVFEAGRPEQGLALRIRCAWENTAQGQPKEPLAELVRLTVAGREVAPELVSRKRANGQVEEHYHRWLLNGPVPGLHTTTAWVRVPATGMASKQTVEFSA